VRLLLDTHILLWALSDDRRLAKSTRELLVSPANEIFVSAASLWEIGIKASLGRIDIEVDNLEAAIADARFEPLPINFSHAAVAGKLPVIHRDPFDRMLIAQAGIEGLRIVTHDRIFERYSPNVQGLAPVIV
jgi:PIN domain nuclease of toxin-antitoxin system